MNKLFGKPSANSLFGRGDATVSSLPGSIINSASVSNGMALWVALILNASAMPCTAASDTAVKEKSKTASHSESKNNSFSLKGTGADEPTEQIPKPKKFYSTIAVINEYGKQVRTKLAPVFQAAGVEYPPKELCWICFKQEKLLKVYAKDKRGEVHQLLSYPIIGASGVAGPKLKEGDKQVPEGFYKLDEFRPNLVAHIGMLVNYPNEEDRQHAKEEKRTNLGCDILIHGSRWSTGCLAMGNEPIEELFVLAYDTGLKNISVIFSPCNLLDSAPAIDMKKQPAWLPPLYTRIRQSLQIYTAGK